MSRKLAKLIGFVLLIGQGCAAPKPEFDYESDLERDCLERGGAYTRGNFGSFNAICTDTMENEDDGSGDFHP